MRGLLLDRRGPPPARRRVRYVARVGRQLVKLDPANGELIKPPYIRGLRTARRNARLLEGRSRGTPLAQTTFDERNAEVSPDGRWLAYQSNESGQYEVYVRPFPEVDGGRWQVSTSGGTRPLWARSGKELFYLGPSGAVMSASVETGQTFRAGNPTKLFEGGYYAPLGGTGRVYDVSPDGQRFLMIKENWADQASAPREIVIVQHWFEELKRLVPTK